MSRSTAIRRPKDGQGAAQAASGTSGLRRPGARASAPLFPLRTPGGQGGCGRGAALPVGSVPNARFVAVTQSSTSIDRARSSRPGCGDHKRVLVTDTRCATPTSRCSQPHADLRHRGGRPILCRRAAAAPLARCWGGRHVRRVDGAPDGGALGAPRPGRERSQTFDQMLLRGATALVTQTPRQMSSAISWADADAGMMCSAFRLPELGREHARRHRCGPGCRQASEGAYLLHRQSLIRIERKYSSLLSRPRQGGGKGGFHILVEDMAGLLKPAAARVLVNTEGRGGASHPSPHPRHSGISARPYLLPSKPAVDAIDAPWIRWSGATSQPCLGSLVEALRHTERDTGLDRRLSADSASIGRRARPVRRLRRAI